MEDITNHVSLYESYHKEKNPDKVSRFKNWSAAIGLQDVDGLKTSKYLSEVARGNIEGDFDSIRAREIIDTYYDVKSDRTVDRHYEEADKVAARINILIGESSFTLSSDEVVNIHRRLFEGVFSHAGQIRTVNIFKHEWVLDGDTVTYAGAYNLAGSLENVLKKERFYSYRGADIEEIVWHLARFCAELWQIHPFMEGNTRTTAVFMIKYLRMIGFDVDNELFRDSSAYFRDALVRANYSNLSKGIVKEPEHLEDFFSDMILGTKHEFKSRYLHIYAKPQLLKETPSPQNLDDAIMNLVKLRPNITRRDIAKALSVSVKTVERHIADMNGRIKYVGPSKGGHWEVK